jgi:hypothetical protein
LPYPRYQRMAAGAPHMDPAVASGQRLSVLPRSRNHYHVNIHEPGLEGAARGGTKSGRASPKPALTRGSARSTTLSHGWSRLPTVRCQPGHRFVRRVGRNKSHVGHHCASGFLPAYQAIWRAIPRNMATSASCRPARPSMRRTANIMCRAVLSFRNPIRNKDSSSW